MGKRGKASRGKRSQRKMPEKKSTVFKDWSFLLLLVVFGCIYTFVWGFPTPGGRAQTIPEETVGETGQGEQGNPEGDLQRTEEVVQPGEEEPDDMQSRPEQTEAPDCGEPEQVDGEVSYRTVEDDFFADAVFIGDSRTVGLYEYGGLEEISTFCCSTGLTIYKMFDDPIVKVAGQKKKLTVEEVLSQRQFSAIYLMLGINEMGVGTVESFIQAYQKRVEHLRELQPGATIYLQGIIKVTNERSEQGDYITNEGIEARNEGIARLADNKDIFYLDVNPLVCDETGGLIADYTHDGVHLRAQYISIWKEYLKSHVAVR